TCLVTLSIGVTPAFAKEAHSVPSLHSNTKTLSSNLSPNNCADDFRITIFVNNGSKEVCYSGNGYLGVSISNPYVVHPTYDMWMRYYHNGVGTTCAIYADGTFKFSSGSNGITQLYGGSV